MSQKYYPIEHRKAILVGLLHAFIGSFIQLYARPYYITDSFPISVTGLFLLALFVSGYISYRLLNKTGLILPISLLLFWIILGALIFIFEIEYYPLHPFDGVATKSRIVKELWVLKDVVDVLNIKAAATPPAADYHLSSLYLFTLQFLGGSVEYIVRYVKQHYF